MAQLAGDFGKVAADGLQRHVILDFSRLTFIRPAGVCFLSNLVQWLDAKRVRTSFEGIGRITPPLKYLDDSLFFKQHLGEKLLPFSAVRSTTLPLRKVASADSHMWLRRTFVPWLSGRLRVPERALSSIQTCVSELFNNITDHTKLDIGSIFIQHFPTERRVIIAVSDFGRGIPRAVRTVRPQLTDSQAIARAVEEGFTSLSSPRNRVQA